MMMENTVVPPNKVQYSINNFNTVIDKNFLAMDSLSKLAKQFSIKPNFERLLNSLLFTLSGQFSVTNAFAMIQQPGKLYSEQLYFGIGKFRYDEYLSTQILTEEHNKYFLKYTEPQKIENITLKGPSANLSFYFQELGVDVIAPLFHDERLLGLLGLGQKVNKKPFNNEELEILGTLVNSIAPFVANSFLFMEISNLNRWYLEILNNVKQGVFVFDKTKSLKNVNEAGFQIISKLKPQLKNIDTLINVPINFVFSDTFFPGWVNRIENIHEDISSYKFENLKAKSNDIENIYNVYVSRLNRDGVEGDIIVTLDDITNQKENEHRMFELEKFADKGVMASSIAHELNNFLGMILGGVEIAEINIEGNNIDKSLSTISKLKDNVLKMKRFTAGLMDYTKLDTSKQKANLNQIIRDVLSFVSVQKKYSGIVLKTELMPNLQDNMIDPDQIAQLLLNFLNNAADAIREKHEKTGSIIVKTFAKDNMVCFSVTDNGIGIEPEVKNKLFKTHLTTKEKGHGYGLITCAKIIDNHNSNVEIKSELGKGSIFTVYLPQE